MNDFENKRIGVLVVAYNAASTLHKVLDRIPDDFRDRVDHILVSDDASTDATYLVGLGYQSTDPHLPVTVLRQSQNLGYGGNQKIGYQWAIDHGLDIVVLLHGDGQYAPELLPEMVAPLVRDECDAVFGSRMLDRGAARRGGMPLYKYAGNKVLTAFENAVMRTSLSEWHSGYRAYSVAALKDIPFERNSAGFDFDTQIIVQLLEAGKTIHEISIPTFYGDEISHVNGIKYGLAISKYVTRYRLQKMGLGQGDLTFATSIPDDELAPGSSQNVVISAMTSRSPRRVLDLACGSGAVAERLQAAGHEVVGVRPDHDPDAAKYTDRLVEADLDLGLPADIGDGYEVVVAEAVFERVREPAELLRDLREHIDHNGTVFATIPNIAHWYPRVRIGTGHFDYDQRGLLDRGHLRFFTRATFSRLAEESGYRVVRVHPVGFPFVATERAPEREATPPASTRWRPGSTERASRRCPTSSRTSGCSSSSQIDRAAVTGPDADVVRVGGRRGWTVALCGLLGDRRVTGAPLVVSRTFGTLRSHGVVGWGWCSRVLAGAPVTTTTAPGTATRRVRMTVAYDGSDYHGFAPQPEIRTVGGTLATSLSRVLRTPGIDLTCAGRTDAGVHGWGQVVSFDVPADRLAGARPAGGRPGFDPAGFDPAKFDPAKFDPATRALTEVVQAVNKLCGPTLVVRDAAVVADDFDARFSARARRYRYTIVNRPEPDPFLARTAWHVRAPLDVRAMTMACDPLFGEHDFSSFCRRPKTVTGEPASLVRRVIDARWDDDDDGLLHFWIEANAFCHQMVRSVVGTLVEVGRGKKRAGEMMGIVQAADRQAAGDLAPPHGLCLWAVRYDGFDARRGAAAG